MFEDFHIPSLSERLRSACFLPLAGFVAVLLASDLEPILGPSRALYWIIDALALGGAFGIGFAVRIAIMERRRFSWRAAFWLLVCLILSLLCAHMFVVLADPFASLRK